MNIRISVRRDLIGACKTQGMTIWSLRKSLKSAKGEIRVSENRTLGLRWCSFTCFSRTTWIISIPLPNSFIKGRGCVGVCVCDVILEYYFQFYKFRGHGGGLILVHLHCLLSYSTNSTGREGETRTPSPSILDLRLTQMRVWTID